MRKNKISVILFFSYFFVNFIVNSQVENTEFHQYPTVKNSFFKGFLIPFGRSEQKFLLSDGKYWDIALYSPDIKKGDKVPLILALHWAGSGDTYKEYSNCLAFPGLEFTKSIIIAPSADGGHWLDPDNEVRVIKLVKQMLNYWPIDPDKVIVTGYSNGGIGSWYYAKKYPKLFTAGLAIAGSYRSSKIKIPIYILHGEDDDLFPVKQVEKAINESIKKGSKVTFKKIPGFSHFNACSYTQQLQQMATTMVKDLHWEK